MYVIARLSVEKEMLPPKMFVVTGLYVEREIVHENEREMQLLKMCVVAGLYVERER